MQTYFIIICYDVKDDKRRARLSNEMENFGRRVQWSVFECDVDEQRLSLMKERILTLTEDEDKVRLYHVCQGCLQRCEVLRGDEGFATDQDYYIV
jgi:CRISPR-associated protein Cas2